MTKEITFDICFFGSLDRDWLDKLQYKSQSSPNIKLVCKNVHQMRDNEPYNEDSSILFTSSGSIAKTQRSAVDPEMKGRIKSSTLNRDRSESVITDEDK